MPEDTHANEKCIWHDVEDATLDDWEISSQSSFERVSSGNLSSQNVPSEGAISNVDKSWDLLTHSAPGIPLPGSITDLCQRVVFTNLQNDVDSNDMSKWMVQLGKDLGVSGPKLISRERYERCRIGSGSQFEVFGHNDVPPPDQMLEYMPKWEGFSVDRIVFKRGRVALERSANLEEESSWWMGSTTGTSSHQSHSRVVKENEQRQVMAIVREMRTLAYPGIRSHPNIVRLLAWGMDLENLNLRSLVTPILVQERAVGTLEQYLRSDDARPLAKFNLSIDALAGLSHLHSEGFFHGDINPRNVLIFANDADHGYVAKIADFSHSGRLPALADDNIWYKGTSGWQAPEIADAKLSTKYAVIALESYSFGLLLWSIFTTKGNPPISTQSIGSNVSKMASRSLQLCNLPANIRGTILDVVPGLLQTNPLDRAVLSKDMLGKKIAIQWFRNKGKALVIATSERIRALEDSFGTFDAKLRRRERREQRKYQSTRTSTPIPGLIIYPGLFDMNYRAWGKFLDFGLGNFGRWTIPAFAGGKASPVKITRHRQNHSQIIEPLKLENMANNASGQEIGDSEINELTGMELFDMAISFYSYDTKRALRFLRQAAVRGDVRAQAICERLCQSHGEPVNQGLGDLPADVLQQWLFNGTATGSLLAFEILKKRHMESASVAKLYFQEKGGYNSQLCQPETEEPIIRLDSFGSFVANKDEIATYPAASTFEGEDRETIFHRAVLSGNVKHFTNVVEKYKNQPRWNLNVENKRGETPLYLTCAAGNLQMTLLLLEHGASAYHGDHLGITPLHWLFAFTDDEMELVCSKLIEGGANLASEGKASESIHIPFEWPAGNPLTWAVFSGSLTAVRTLGDAILELHEKGTTFYSTLFEPAVKVASLNYDGEMMTEVLQIGTGIGINLEDFVMKSFEWDLAHVSEDFLNVELTAAPLKGDWKYDMVHRIKHGSTAEIQKKRQGLIGCVMKYATSRIADDSGSSRSGNAAILSHIIYLNKAISQGNPEVALRLIQKHGKHYSKDDLGRALYINIQSNWAHPSSESFPAFMDIFRALIGAGANVNAIHPDSLGNSLFHVIIRRYADHPKNTELSGIRQLCLLLLKILISCGVKVNALNLVRLTPLDYAFHNARTWETDRDLVNLLLNNGAQRTALYSNAIKTLCDGPVDDTELATADRRLTLGASQKHLLWKEADEVVFEAPEEADEVVFEAPEIDTPGSSVRSRSPSGSTTQLIKVPGKTRPNNKQKGNKWRSIKQYIDEKLLESNK